MRRAVVTVLGAALVLVLVLVGCATDASDSSGSGRPQIVVTHSVLGAAVTQLVGDTADVEVIIPNGIDPHDFRPSARDVERLTEADLVVMNGLELETGLNDAIERADESGTPVFVATDHIDVRELGNGEPGHAEDDEHADDDEHNEDPHFWLDPIAMRDAMVALSDVVGSELGIELGERTETVRAELDELDIRTRQLLHQVPPEQRVLVTGHESMGYFADRYDYEVVGAIIPSSSTQAEPSAAQIAELKEIIDEHDVQVVFNELGTPPEVAQTIADETGARVVELPTHTVPDDGSYVTFIDQIARAIADNLLADARQAG